MLLRETISLFRYILPKFNVNFCAEGLLTIVISFSSSPSFDDIATNIGMIKDRRCLYSTLKGD